MADRLANETGPVAALNALGLTRSLAVVIASVLSAFWLLLAVTFGVLPAEPGLRNRLGGVAAGDFVFFYAAGASAAEGRAGAAYDARALTEVAIARIGPNVPELVWPYPPTLSLPLVLLGAVPAPVALVLWIAVLLTGLLAVGRFALGSWREAPLVLLYPGSAFVLFTGHLTAVLTAFVTVYALTNRGTPLRAGASLGLLTWKPHFAVVPLVTALLDRHYRIVGWAAATFAALVLVSLAAFGVDTWTAFLAGGLRHAGLVEVEAPMFRFASAFGTARTFGIPSTAAIAVHTGAAAIGLAIGLTLWRHAGRNSFRTLGLTSAMLLVTPYALDYDLAFLLLPWALMIREAQERPADARYLVGPWLIVTSLVPASYFASLYTNRATAGVMILLLLVYVWRRSKDDRALAPTSP